MRKVWRDKRGREMITETVTYERKPEELTQL